MKPKKSIIENWRCKQNYKKQRQATANQNVGEILNNPRKQTKISKSMVAVLVNTCSHEDTEPKHSDNTQSNEGTGDDSQEKWTGNKSQIIPITKTLAYIIFM